MVVVQSEIESSDGSALALAGLASSGAKMRTLKSGVTRQNIAVGNVNGLKLEVQADMGVSWGFLLVICSNA